jgi:hypothetical protein
MKHRCSQCGRSATASSHEPLHLPCDCDDGEIETLRWCDDCDDHMEPADSAKRNHWTCPECDAVWRFV